MLQLTRTSAPWASRSTFQTPSAGRWVLQRASCVQRLRRLRRAFQTPSAGRWVLQLRDSPGPAPCHAQGFKPHQRGGGCCSLAHHGSRAHNPVPVSNPISGEVGAAADGLWTSRDEAKVEVSNPISGEVGAAARQAFPSRPSGQDGFKPHQRGGGCCSLSVPSCPPSPCPCFKPHQRGGGCCSLRHARSKLGKW